MWTRQRDGGRCAAWPRRSSIIAPAQMRRLAALEAPAHGRYDAPTAQATTAQGALIMPPSAEHIAHPGRRGDG